MPRILIVDDEEDQEEIIVQKFANKPFLRGYEFMFARDGWDALKKIKDYPDIEVALVDINMPEMDGLTFLKKSKTYNPSLCAIIVSAYGDISNIRTAMNNGAFDFLTKPIDLVDLEATLRKTLSHAVQLKEIEKTANENLQLKQKAFDLEMQALRAQMNPHFIFNSLNSSNSLGTEIAL